MPFFTGGVNLNDFYITDADIVDQYLNGKLWTWGNNDYGQLGDNTGTNRSSPVQTITGGTNWKQVSCGTRSTAAIKTDGTLWTWGSNSYGQLGDNTGTNRSSPVQTITGGTSWKQVSCGKYFTAAVKTDGTLWSWGNNGYGELGDGTGETYRSSPVQTIAGGSIWKQVSCGSGSTAAIKTDGTLWTWGNNISGQLGDGTRTDRSSPVQTISGGTNWKQVSCGYRNTAAIKTDGTLWTWGDNFYGQLGDGTSTSRSSPVQTITGGSNWKQVSCGSNSTAIKTDGTLWTWGNNRRGELGDGTETDRSSPVQTIAGGSNWKQVSCGSRSTAAIKTDGTLWTWGLNTFGLLGDGTSTSRSSPVQTIAGGSNWKQVAFMSNDPGSGFPNQGAAVQNNG